MSGKFFSDLALQNIRRNRQSYLPYALSCAGMVAIFFIMGVLAGTDSLRGVYGGRTLQQTLTFGVWVMLLFSVIFLFYTHSFLIKRRRKEFGLFNILGMEKKHIGRVLAIETAIVGLASTAAGMALGALLCRLMYLLLLRLLGAQLATDALHIPRSFVITTLMVFGAIHGLTLLNTLRQVHLARPVELLRGGSLGEKEPRARRWLALLGLACLIGGYAISLTAQHALKAIPQFFLAVVLVILATYALFIAGSVSALRLMQRNQRFYYQPRHFSVIAGMRHRMNRNAAGLASICILSTMVLVMVAATASLFAGRDDVLRSRFPREAMFSFAPVEQGEQTEAVKAILYEETQRAGGQVSNLVMYRNVSFVANLQGGTIRYLEQIDSSGGVPEIVVVDLISSEMYEQVTGEKSALAPGEILAYSSPQPLPKEVQVGGVPLRIARRLADIAPFNGYSNLIAQVHVLFVPQDTLNSILDGINSQRTPEARQARPMDFALNFAYDTGAIRPEDAQHMLGAVRDRVSQLILDQGSNRLSLSAHHILIDRGDFNALYGGLLFVAVFLGLVFLMAMVLLIYYKQVSEGYEDKDRFLIMQQVGMSRQEVKRSIKSQVLMVFFLPLLMAGLHLIAAFNITAKVLNMLMLTNTALFALVTLATYLGFTLFYAGVYWKTARSYYKIVKA